MKVKINNKWFEGRFDDNKNFTIPLSDEEDIKFFYKWGNQSKWAGEKEDYVEDIEYRKICESGTLHGCYPILSPNEDEVILHFDVYKTKEVYE
jgi:hypothetical protein